MSPRRGLKKTPPSVRCFSVTEAFIPAKSLSVMFIVGWSPPLAVHLTNHLNRLEERMSM